MQYRWEWREPEWSKEQGEKKKKGQLKLSLRKDNKPKSRSRKSTSHDENLKSGNTRLLVSSPTMGPEKVTRGDHLPVTVTGADYERLSQVQYDQAIPPWSPNQRPMGN